MLVREDTPLIPFLLHSGLYQLYVILPWVPLASQATLEVHISKAGMVNGVMRDCHEKPDEATYHILHHIVDICQPEYLVVEYYKDSDVLLDTYRELRMNI